MVVFNNNTFNKEILTKFDFVKNVETGDYEAYDLDGNLLMYMEDGNSRLFLTDNIKRTTYSNQFDVLDKLQDLFHHGIFISEFDSRSGVHEMCKKAM